MQKNDLMETKKIFDEYSTVSLKSCCVWGQYKGTVSLV